MTNFYRPRVLLEAHGSDSSSTSSAQMTADQLASLYSSTVSSALGSINSTADSTAQSIANASANANPVYTQSVLDQLGNYASQYLSQGNELSSEQLSAQKDLYGSQDATDLATEQKALINETNPTLAAAETAATNLVNSYNLNGLSAGEQSAVERSLAQSNYATGNLGLDNATNAVSNAMNYGNALETKRQSLENAINTANNVANTSNTAYNAVTSVGNSSDTSTNQGLSYFNPTQSSSTADTAYTTASNYGSQLAQVGSSQTSTSDSTSGGGGVCFLTTLVCKIRHLADDCFELQTLRDIRDRFVPSELVSEYYKLQHILEPFVSSDRMLQDKVWNTVKRCVKLYAENKHYIAVREYCQLINELKLAYDTRCIN